MIKKTTLIAGLLFLITTSLWAQNSPSQAERYQALNKKVENLQTTLHQWTENLSLFLESDSISDSVYYQLEEQTSELNTTIKEITREAKALAREKANKNKADPTLEKAKVVIAEGVQVLGEGMQELGESLNKLSQKLSTQDEADTNEKQKQ
jgi:ABC-type transporter Mla subunit MlaD